MVAFLDAINVNSRFTERYFGRCGLCSFAPSPAVRNFSERWLRKGGLEKVGNESPSVSQSLPRYRGFANYLAGVAPLRGPAVRLRFLLRLREVSPSAEESDAAPPS